MSDRHHKPDPMRRILLVGCGLPIILAIGLLAGVLVWSRIQFDSLRDDMNAAGEPLTLEALNDWYAEPPPGENGADVLVRAAQSIDPAPPGIDFDRIPILGTNSDPESLAPSREPWDASVMAMSRKYLDAQPVTMDLLLEATDYHQFRYPADLRDIGVVLPHLAELRSLGRHASLAANVAARRGDADEAVKWLNAGSHVAYSIRGEPLLISQLVSIACAGLFVAATEECITLVEFDHEQLDAIGAMADKLPGPDSMKTAMIGERAYYLSQPPMGLPVIRNFDRMVYTGRINELIRLADKPPRTIAERADSIGSVGYVPRLTRFFLPSTTIGMPAISRSSDAFLRTYVYKESLRVAVAIEHYRLDHGDLPAALDALVPTYLEALPEDPYSNGPLMYLQQDPGYVVYSVGPNRTDEQGAAIGGNLTGDIPFRVNR